MDMGSTEQPQAEKTIMAARLIWAGISGGVVLMGAIGAALQQGILPRPPMDQAQLPLGVVRMLAYGMAAAAIPVSALIKKMVFKSLPKAANTASAVAGGVAVLCAVSEGPALLGLVLLSLGGRGGEFASLWLVSAVLLAYNFPFREQWLSALRREKTPPAVG